MNATLSRVANATDTNTTDTTLAAVIGEIAGPKHRALIDKIRATYAAHLPTGRKAAKDSIGTLKRGLPAVMFSGQFSARRAAGLVTHSGLIVADLDELGPDLARVAQLAKDDPHAVACFRSPSGDGLKIVYRCDPSDHAAAFRSMGAHVLARYGIAPDPSGKDVSRLCFVSHDPAAVVNADALPLPAVSAPVTANPILRADPVAAPRPRISTSAPQRDTTADDIRAFLSAIPPRPDYGTWLRIASAVWSVLSMEEGCRVLNEWSPEEHAGEYAAKHRHRLAQVGVGTLVHYAKQHGYKTNVISYAWEPPGAEGIEPDCAEGAASADSTPAKKLTALEALELRRLNLSSPPPRPEPVLLCAGVPVATRGDITAILAPAKSGKSAWVGAAIAAAVVTGQGITTKADCLGIVAGARPDHGIVLLIDTEQSEADQFDLAHRAARRAGVPVLPDWVLPYNLVGASAGEIRAMLTAKLADLKASGVPVWFVVIDGIADLCEDPNDLRESQDLVREVHGHARAADCPILAVIHRNEGRDADASARGHLGKQIARKAAFNLTLEKDGNEVTVVFSTKNRGAPILKKDGPRFQWCAEAKMHVTVAGEVDGDDVEELLELAKDVFVKADQLTHGELHAGIMAVSGKRKTWANVQIKELKLNDIIRASGGGKYVMV